MVWRFSQRVNKWVHQFGLSILAEPRWDIWNHGQWRETSNFTVITLGIRPILGKFFGFIANIHVARKKTARKKLPCFPSRLYLRSPSDGLSEGGTTRSVPTVKPVVSWPSSVSNNLACWFYDGWVCGLGLVFLDLTCGFFAFEIPGFPIQ